MSIPAATCRRTMSLIAASSRRSYSAMSWGLPEWKVLSSVRDLGRGMLPTWVVRIRSTLRCKCPSEFFVIVELPIYDDPGIDIPCGKFPLIKDEENGAADPRLRDHQGAWRRRPVHRRRMAQG